MRLTAHETREFGEALVADRPGRALRPALLSPAWPPGAAASGIVTYIEQLSAGLREVGAEPRVMTHELAAAATRDRHVYRLPAEGSHHLLARAWRGVQRRWSPRAALDVSVGRRIASLATQLHEAGEIDLLEMEESFGWGAWVKQRTDVPVVVRLHGPWLVTGAAAGEQDTEEYKRRVEAEGRAIAAVDGVTSPSEAVLDAVRRHYGLPLPHARVIANPISPAAARDAWSPDAAQPGVILFVGRFDRLKGADVLMEAFAKLVIGGVGCELWFVGPDAGLRQADGTLQNLPQFTQELPPQVRERITNHGRVAGEEIRKLRRRAAVTVIASRYENFPMTGLEAMSHGCPIVAARVGGLAEMIQHGCNGLLFECGSANDLAAQLRIMLDHPQRAAEMGRQAAADCLARYHPRAIAQQTLDYYAQVLQRSGGRLVRS